MIAPDQRGHGDSAWLTDGGYYHFMDYVADLDDMIAQLARKHVILVGHSMGGSVCGYYAGTRPQRLTALALIEGIGPPDMAAADGPTRTAMWIDDWKAARAKGKPMDSLAEAVRRLRKHDHLLDAETALDLAEHGTRSVGDKYIWKHDPLHMTMGPYPYRLDTAIKYWQRVTCPVLIVDGEESRLNLAADDRAARRSHFKTHRHVTIPAAAHAVQRHQPAALAALLLELSSSERR